MRKSFSVLALLGLLAGQAFAACNHSASVAGRLLTCCGGTRQFLQICTTGGSPGCDPSAHRVSCGGCQVNQAAHCTVAASNTQTEAMSSPAKMDRVEVGQLLANVVGAPAVGCGVSLDQWVDSHRHVNSKVTTGAKTQPGF